MKYVLSFFCGIVLFAACTTTKVDNRNAKSGEVPEITDISLHEWKLVSVVMSNKLSPVEDAKKQAIFRIEADGKIHGQSGCNDFLGTSKIEGTNVKFEAMVATQKACFDMSVETAFFDALEAADSFVLENSILKLKKADKIVAVFSTDK
jgi:putative lipoprotein